MIMYKHKQVGFFLITDGNNILDIKKENLLI